MKYYWLGCTQDKTDLKNWECKLLWFKWHPKRLWKEFKGIVIVEKDKVWDTTRGNNNMSFCNHFIFKGTMVVSQEVGEKFKEYMDKNNISFKESFGTNYRYWQDAKGNYGYKGVKEL